MADLDPLNYTYYFTYEKTFAVDDFNTYMNQHWGDSLIYSAFYLIVIFAGKHVMQHRKRFELRPYLAIWSGLLAIFSIIGTLRTLPELVSSIGNNSLEYSCCVPSYMGTKKITCFWTALFTLSKLFELGDTIFIVLRKQNLMFLHWYHHVTVLCYTWYSYSEQIANGRWYMVMNFLVHSFMYSYYALRAMKFMFPKWVNMFITSLQILQMIGGITVNIVAYQALKENRFCVNNYRNIQFALVMYFSYFVLFAQFFYTTYIAEKPRLHEKAH